MDIQGITKLVDFEIHASIYIHTYIDSDYKMSSECAIIRQLLMQIRETINFHSQS